MIADQEKILSRLSNDDDRLRRQSEDLTTMREPETPSVENLQCSVFLEETVAANQRFGIQNNCDHFFCFDCLSSWHRMVNLS